MARRRGRRGRFAKRRRRRQGTWMPAFLKRLFPQRRRKIFGVF